MPFPLNPTTIGQEHDESGVRFYWDGTVWRVKGHIGPAGPPGQVGVQGIQGIQGPSGSGVGDMLKSENLSGLTNLGAARTNLGLGTSATVNTGTSGATIPLLSTQNYWTTHQVFNANPYVDKPAGNSREVIFSSTGLLRWSHGANATAESGSNAGSDYVVARFNDAGSYVDVPLFISRATGITSFSATPYVGADAVWHAGNFDPATNANLTGATFSGDITLSSTNKVNFFNSNYFVRASTGLELQSLDVIRFLTSGANERMRIGATGNVGIATTNPTSRLHISGVTDVGGVMVESNNAASSAPPVIVIGKRSDSNASQSFSGKLLLVGNQTNAAVAANKKLGTVAFGGNHTDGTLANVLYPASISGVSEGTFSNATTMPTSIAFFTGTTGRDSDTANVDFGTERMRITSTGNVGIGTTNPSQKFNVEGNAVLRGVSPTLYLRDTDNRSAMIHVNSNLFYVLRGTGTDSEGWATVNGQWPLMLNLETNNVTLGGLLDTWTGSVGVQTGMHRIGWSNGVPRFQWALEANAGYTLYTYDATGVYVGAGIHIANNTNVGIGTLTPAHKLEVHGAHYWNGGGYWVDGIQQFIQTGTTGMATGTGSLGRIEVFNNSTGAAFMTFHRTAAYAAYFGLDTDNQWKVGGWSAGAVAHKIWHAGNHGSGSTLDADLLDGIDGSWHVKGFTANRTGAIVSNDWNNSLPSGFFESSTGANAPSTNWWWGINFRHSSTGNQYGWQMLGKITSNDYRLRYVSNGTWGPWVSMYHTGNITSGTAAPGTLAEGAIYLRYT